MDDPGMMAGLFMFVAGLAFAMMIFLIFRKVTLWYLKIDKIEEHLAAIRKNLEK